MDKSQADDKSARTDRDDVKCKIRETDRPPPPTLFRNSVNLQLFRHFHNSRDSITRVFRLKRPTERALFVHDVGTSSKTHRSRDTEIIINVKEDAREPC